LLRTHLEESKAKLEAHYRAHYAKPISTPVSAQSSTSSMSVHSPQKVDFTSRYNKRMRLNIDEIGEFFKLLPESFAVDPIQWWAGRRAQFPNLSRLARDILSIPGVFLLFALKYSSDVSKGSAVAVERIFSGARDTISLRRASLKPETIRTLMLVKQRLRLARGAIWDIIGD
jgi:hypothetical protein